MVVGGLLCRTPARSHGGAAGRWAPLEWSGPMVVKRGAYPQAMLQLVNDRATTWVDNRGEYWGIGHVLDGTTGKPVASGNVGIAGVGRTYRLTPAATVRLPVAWPPDVRALRPGTYDIVVCVPGLAWARPSARCEFTSGRAPGILEEGARTCQGTSNTECEGCGQPLTESPHGSAPQFAVRNWRTGSALPLSVVWASSFRYSTVPPGPEPT